MTETRSNDMVQTTATSRPRKAGKWSEFLAALDQQPGIIVCNEEMAQRVRADRPSRDVRVDERGTRGSVLVFTFETLPLHLYTAAERRRASR
jgi:hypothetical protein